MVIINSDISHQSRVTEPRGKYDARNMALQGNQETNTKPEGNANSLQPEHTCLSRLLQEKFGDLRKVLRLEDTTEKMKQKKMLCCITENPERIMGTLDPRKENLEHPDRPAGGCYSLKGCLGE